MTLTRRSFTTGTAGALASAALARPALADSEPLRIGWLAALTGPSSAPGIGFDRGVRYAVVPFLYDEAGAKLRRANLALTEMARSDKGMGNRRERRAARRQR